MNACLTVLFFMLRFFGNSLLTIGNYEMWKTRRRIYDPAFNKRQLLYTSWIQVHEFWLSTCDIPSCTVIWRVWCLHSMSV